MKLAATVCLSVVAAIAAVTLSVSAAQDVSRIERASSSTAVSESRGAASSNQATTAMLTAVDGADITLVWFDVH